MNNVVNKWIAQRVAAVLMIPILLWFLFNFDNMMTYNYDEAMLFLNNKLNLSLISLIFVLAFFHMRIGMGEIFEDYIHDEKIKKILNHGVLGISLIIPIAAIVSMIILGL